MQRKPRKCVITTINVVILKEVRRISEFQTRISYPSIDDHLGSHKSAFLKSDPGQIHRAFPWGELVSSLGLRTYQKEPEAIFSPKGKLALMFLKNYSGCSDSKLIESSTAIFIIKYFVTPY
ncbi:MAG: hypothetical protein ACI9QN_001678 [Arcticibacterium sp.]|jgi:hypothetical protein